MILRSDLIFKVSFIDFEASSLDPDGWPIEVGLSCLEDGVVKTWSSLIQPHVSWGPGGWSEQSADVHGIGRDALAGAPSAQDVADALISRLHGRIVVSDAPEHDQAWLDQLLDASSQTAAIIIRDFDNASFSAFDGLDLDRLYEALERRKSPHRAGPDSARLAGAWAAAARSRRGQS